MSAPSTTTRGKAFERRVAQLFALLGFDVRLDVDVGGHQVDLLLELELGPIRSRFVVECKDLASPVGSEDYTQLFHRLTTARQVLGDDVRAIFVTTVGYTRNVTVQAQHNGVQLLTISELERSIIDFERYLRDLLEELDFDPTLAHFVEPRIRREGERNAEPAFDVLREWLSDPLSNQLTLLGDYGTGKTTVLKALIRQLAAEYKERALDGGARVRVPIFIHLPQFAGSTSLDEVLHRFLERYGIKTATLQAFDHMSREGQLLVVLDGFDEMASRGDAQATLRSFREFNCRALGRAKIVLSCRSHYFTSHKEVRFLMGEPHADPALPKAYTDLYHEIAARSNFSIATLEDFTPAEIERYLEARCGDARDDVERLIGSTYRLREISRRPVFLDMIVTAGPRLAESRETLTPGLLYAFFTGIWLENNDWTTALTPQAKAELLEKLAHHAETRPQAHFPRGDISHLISRWQHELPKDELERIDRELRTASFLVADEDGNYRFSHRSFQEFFYARHLLAAARRGQAEFWGQRYFRSEIYRFLKDLLPTSPESVTALLAWVADGDGDELVRSNAVKCLAGLAGKRVIETLLALATDPARPTLQAHAATALGAYGEARSVALLEDLVEDRGTARRVRSNALIALMRIDSEETTSFLAELLERPPEGTEGASSAPLWSLFKVAAKTPSLNPCLAAALIRHGHERLLDAPRTKDVLQACLELCSRHPSPAATAFCHAVFEHRFRPSLAAAAMSALPEDDRRRRAAEVIGLFGRHADPARHTGHFERLVESLRGIDTAEVRDFLERLTASNDGKLDVAAFDVLTGIDPRRAAELALDGFSERRTHLELRLRMARHLAEASPPGALDCLLTIFERRERVATRIAVLNLVAEHFPDALPELVREVWAREPVAGVKRHAAELLRGVDPGATLGLLIEKGLADARLGTRATSCELLAAEHDPRATEALLDRLRRDHAAAVRLQAMRSLLRGHDAPRRRVLEASEGETDPEVLKLRRGLLQR